MTRAGVGGGPSLETYVETRFNLIVESVKEQMQDRDTAFLAFAESQKAMAAALKIASEAAVAATDLRYQQRFEAQSDALAAAFAAAKEAVQAAMAAADRAISKAELAADKRFEALNELRKMLNDMMATLMPRVEAEQRFTMITEKINTNAKRIETISGQALTVAGEASGDRRSHDDARGQWALWISVAAVVLALIGFLVTQFNK